MIKQILFSILILFSWRMSTAQKLTISCGTDSLPRYQKSLFKDKQSGALPTGSVKARLAAPTSATYSIPIMFVVYHEGEAVGNGSNLSDQRLQDALVVLNKAFKGSYPNGIDAGIQFVLAKRLPDCSPTTGIYRINASGFPNYTSQGLASYEDAFSLAAAYPPFNKRSIPNFITVRIVNDLQFAGGFTWNNEIYLSSSGSDGFTLAHEMGHVFNLLHTFQGSSEVSTGSNTYTCPPNTSPLTQGDLVADTDPHQYGDFTCSSASINTCTGQPFGLLGVNLMNYACGRIFTQGQVNRMRAKMVDEFPSLSLSHYGESPNPNETVKSANCTITFGYPPTDFINGIGRFQFNTIDILSESSPTGNISGNYNDFSCGQKTTVQANTTYPFSLTAYSTRRKIYIDYNNDGNFNETNELVFNSANYGASGNITIPSTATTGVYLRMRVVVDEGSAAPTACYLPGHPTYGCGEIQDFGLLVQGPCNQLYTIKSGSWNDPAIWSCNRVPNQSDQLIISAGHSVTVTNALATARQVKYSAGAKLIFTAGSKLTLSSL